MLIKSKTKVDKLTEQVENLYDQKQSDELKADRQLAALKTINEAKDFSKQDFWCRKHGDITAMAYKVVFKSFGELKAYYEAFTHGFPKEMTACCKGLKRYITDKDLDPYYGDSRMIRKQQREAQDKGWLLQPGQEGFTTKYGDPNKKKWAKMEQDERLKYDHIRS